MVCFADINQIPNFTQLPQDDNVCPDKRESAIVAHTVVCLPENNRLPATEYFEQLRKGRTSDECIDFSDKKLAFFIYILKDYAIQDYAIRSSNYSKQYNKKIGKEDQMALEQQASDCFNLFALSSTILTISQIILPDGKD